MDVEALTKRLRTTKAHETVTGRCYDVPINPDGHEAADALDALKRERDANSNLAVANGARAKEEHYRAEAAEARAKELEREVREWESTMKYCDGRWREERGTMFDKIQVAEARATALFAEVERLTRIEKAAVNLYEKRLAWSDGRHQFWEDLRAALEGKDNG